MWSRVLFPRYFRDLEDLDDDIQRVVVMDRKPTKKNNNTQVRGIGSTGVRTRSQRGNAPLFTFPPTVNRIQAPAAAAPSQHAPRETRKPFEDQSLDADPNPMEWDGTRFFEISEQVPFHRWVAWSQGWSPRETRTPFEEISEPVAFQRWVEWCQAEEDRPLQDENGQPISDD